MKKKLEIILIKKIKCNKSSEEGKKSVTFQT